MSSGVMLGQRAVTGASVRLEDVRIGYDGVPVLAETTVDVAPGEVFAVVGPSGCGKSTLLRALAGLLPCSAGRILVDDDVVTGTSGDRAMVFQEDGLLPWLSVLSNIELPLSLRGSGKRDRRAAARALLSKVGLDGFERHLPRQLSGGMRQRVQLARSLVSAPRVILMDEPFGALDAQTRSTMQQLLIDVWRQTPTTLVFVTHDVDEALLIADRVAVLSRGPGRIRAIVETPRPRDGAARDDPATLAARDHILAELSERPNVTEMAS